MAKASITPVLSLSSSSKKKKTSLLLKWLLLSFIIVVLVLLSSSYRAAVHNTIINDADAGARRGNSLSNLMHIQKLLDETNALIKELGIGTSSYSNVNFAKQDSSNNTMIDSDKATSVALIPLQTELLSMYASLAHTEDALMRCVDERHKKEIEIDRCHTALGKVTDSGLHENKGNDGITINNHNNDARKWLLIGIPTVPRAHGEKYLLHTLESISKELPDDPLNLVYGRIIVHVVNVYGSTHDVFEEAKANFGTGNKSMYFKFTSLEAGEILPDPVPGRNQVNDLGNANHPGYRVRKQTRSIASVIKKTAGEGDTYLFLEDDMRFCPHGFTAIQYLLDKASRYHPDWLAIRASYGMNGVFMRKADALVFADYLLKHQTRRPPDHLVVEWYAGETKESAEYKMNRKNIGFRYNLFSHMGSSSTLRQEAAAPMPICYEQLLEPVVFKVEAFDPIACPADDVWPCQAEYLDHHGFSKINFDSLRKQ